MTKTLVIGLGNPLLGDDGAGWHVAEQVRQMPGITTRLIEVDCLSVGGLGLMERLVGYDRAVLIDTINLEQGPTGSVYCFKLEELGDPCAGHLASAHETSLQTALKLGRELGVHLPDHVTVVAIESPNVYDFSETLTAPVSAAIPLATRIVFEILEE